MNIMPICTNQHIGSLSVDLTINMHVKITEFNEKLPKMNVNLSVGATRHINKKVYTYKAKHDQHLTLELRLIKDLALKHSANHQQMTFVKYL